MMKYKSCRCGGTSTDVIYAEENTRVGWYCTQCKSFDKAIGRERLVDDEVCTMRGEKAAGIAKAANTRAASG